MQLAIETTLTFFVEECITCGVRFGIPQGLVDRRRENHQEFFCPNGHSMYYSGLSEAEKLRAELKRKEQELADQVQEKLWAQQDIEKLQKKLKRVHKGTCPCCKRSFQDLKRHMETKHPELANA
jgi:hypothetical protein